MPSRRVRPGTFKFILLGAVFMLLVDMFLMPDKTELARQQVKEAKQQAETASIDNKFYDETFQSHFPSGEIEPNRLKETRLPPSTPVFVLPEIQDIEEDPKAEANIIEPQTVMPAEEIKESAVTGIPPEGFKMNNNYDGKPAIAIVIDDVGISRPLSWKTTELPAPMTLAFLPYAENIGEMVEAAQEKGHEIIVHFPMEPMNPDIDPGPISLLETQDKNDFQENLDRGLSAFEGYKGVNNHMGSRLTQNKQAMEALMTRLKEQDLYFLDSRTIHTSVAAETAFEMNVPYAVRDVFLDHDPSYEGVMRSLKRAEKVALETGQAIAIGHPKENTIKAILDWLPTLEEKDIVLVPLSDLIIRDFDETPTNLAQENADDEPDVPESVPEIEEQDLEYDPVLELLLAR